MPCFTSWDIGGCGCECILTLLGCQDLPLAGVAVTAYSAADGGGSVLGTGTTAADGTVPVPPGAASITATHPRFLASTRNGNPCGQSYTLSPADGYYCWLCAWPLPATLNASIAGAGADSGDGTLTYDLGDWTGAVGGFGSVGLNPGPGMNGGYSGMASDTCGCDVADTAESWTCPPSFHYTGSCECGTLDITE